jgi:hypothetical protein
MASVMPRASPDPFRSAALVGLRPRIPTAAAFESHGLRCDGADQLASVADGRHTDDLTAVEQPGTATDPDARSGRVRLELDAAGAQFAALADTELAAVLCDEQCARPQHRLAADADPAGRIALHHHCRVEHGARRDDGVGGDEGRSRIQHADTLARQTDRLGHGEVPETVPVIVRGRCFAGHTIPLSRCGAELSAFTRR